MENDTQHDETPESSMGCLTAVLMLLAFVLFLCASSGLVRFLMHVTNTPEQGGFYIPTI